MRESQTWRGYRSVVLVMVLTGALVGCRRGAERQPVDRHVVRAQQLMITDPRKALAELDKAKDQQAPLVTFAKAFAHEELGEYAAARDAYRLSLASKADPNTRLGLTRVSIMLGDLSAARQTLDPLLTAPSVSAAVALVETCLASDRPRAERALSHVDALRNAGSAPKELDKSKAGSVHRPSAAENAVLVLASAALVTALEQGDRARELRRQVDKLTLSDPGLGVVTAKLAVRAGQRPFARLLLEKLAGKTSSLADSRQVALLAHELHETTLAGKALETIPEGDPAVLTLRALQYASSGHPSAERTIRKALVQVKTPKEAMELRLLLSDVLMREQKLDLAQKELDEADRLVPNAVGATLQRARIQLLAGKPAEALVLLATTKEDERALPVHEVWATAALQAGDLGTARRELESILNLRPDHQRALEALLGLELKQNGPKAALSRLERQVSAVPKSGDLRLLLAATLRQQGRKADAEAALRRGMVDVPADPRLSAALARMQVARNAVDEAERTLLDALARDAKSLRIVAELAAFYSRTGRPEKALPYYGQVADFAGASPIALNNAAMLYADEMGDAKKAVEYAERAYDLARNRPAIADTLGWALYLRDANGDLKRALELLESVKAELNVPTARYHLGMVLLKAGKVDEARQALTESLGFDGEFPEAAAAREALAKLG